MTDGMYKTIEATFQQSATIDPNKVLLIMNKNACTRLFEVISDQVIEKNA